MSKRGLGFEPVRIVACSNEKGCGSLGTNVGQSKKGWSCGLDQSAHLSIQLFDLGSEITISPCDGSQSDLVRRPGVAWSSWPPSASNSYKAGHRQVGYLATNPLGRRDD